MRLETARLTIREFEAGDADAVHVYASDPDVTKHMIWGPNTAEETRAFVHLAIGWQREAPRRRFELAVVRKDDGVLIGGCGLHVDKPDIGEIGYCFGKDHWNRGYASEAAAALLRFGFGELGLHRIYATCRPDNIGSARVMQKIGMTYEGRLREHMYHKGAWHDSFQYAILDREFTA